MPPRTLSFAGYEWLVKAPRRKVGPGPNWWSDRESDVWVEDVWVEDAVYSHWQCQHLHLTIKPRGRLWWRKWYCTEVILDQHLGYGTYEFTVDTPEAELGDPLYGGDPNVVLGCFAYPEGPKVPDNVGEIDAIEISRWGKVNGPNMQFAVQPYKLPDHIRRMRISTLGPLTYKMVWDPARVTFGISTTRGYVTHWEYPHPVPLNNQRVHINLWPYHSKPLSPDYEGSHVVISDFTFKPLSIKTEMEDCPMPCKGCLTVLEEDEDCLLDKELEG